MYQKYDIETYAQKRDGVGTGLGRLYSRQAQCFRWLSLLVSIGLGGA
jgi:hypothetical protein